MILQIPRIKLVMPMLKKHIPAVLIIALLFLSFCQLSRSEVQPSQTSVAGWQVENKGGYYSESNGIFQLGTNGGSDNPGVSLYKQIHPTGDFNYSVQVKANVNESCALFLRGSLPIHNGSLPYFGVNFEYGHYGAPVFLLARPCENQIWTLSQVAYSPSIEWYTMQLTVYASPFKIQVSVLDENGTLLGTYSATDITNFRFEDVKYIGFYAWGYSPGDYLFKNIQLPFDQSTNQPVSASISGWQVEDLGGYYSEANGVFNLWSNGGIDCPSIALYKQINIINDFNFSLQVNAATVESCAVVIRGSLPVAGSTNGFNFEFGHYGQGNFLFARNCSDWIPTQVAYGDANTWYTMQLSVCSKPFSVTASVLDENESLIGRYSTTYITNFSFEDIKYLGFDVWGFSPANYSFRNIESSLDNPSRISINTESISTTAGSAVNVFGKLIDSTNVALQNKTIVLSYTFPGADSWIPISSAKTDEDGNYVIQWINSASGTFTLKTEWSGDATNAHASNTTTLSFLPIENKSTFVIESNSTVNELTFNNNTSTLSFNVTGPSGTKGYIKATIAKSLLSDGEGLQAYIDGKPLNYSLTSTDDSWIYTFNYSHSTHQISMHINANTSESKTAQTQPQGSNIILIAIIILFSTILILATISLLRSKQLAPKSAT